MVDLLINGAMFLAGMFTVLLIMLGSVGGAIYLLDRRRP